MASSLSNFFGWQVMDPNLVRDDQWDEFYQVYVKDKLDVDINQWFEQTNPKSQANMIERMLDASRKEYWQADAQTLKDLIERYQYLVNQYNLVVENEKLREYAEQQATGFGLELKLPVAEAPALDVSAAANAQATEQVSGQKLEKQQQNTNQAEPDITLYALFAGCLLFVFAGVLKQMLWRREAV